MESALTKACTIKIQNFEGPFDLLFHLIEKNKFDLLDIPMNEITDQYMEYLFSMQEMDMEVASEFLVMAATLIHIKSRMLLPIKKEQQEEELDPREELVLRLVQYKKYKEFAAFIKGREEEWGKLFYKLPEVYAFEPEYEPLHLSEAELRRVYCTLLQKNRRKTNVRASQITQLIQHEKVSLRSKMRDIIHQLIHKTCFVFSDIFSLRNKSRTEVVTGFLAILELAKLKSITIEQKRQFDDLLIHRVEKHQMHVEDEEIAAVKEY